MKVTRLMVAVLLAASLQSGLQASSGTEGASFLDIPVGARPASLGGAYSALSTDAYAPVYNPAGLAWAQTKELAAQHLSYIESINYEYLGYAHPLGQGRAVAGSIQYLGSGDIAGTDQFGNPTGSYTSHYGAYSVAYGQSLTSRLSLGITAKVISAKISDVSATAYAFDVGSMLRLTRGLTLAAVLTNMGSKLTFIDQSDSLPLAFHLAAAYQTIYHFNLSTEAIFRQTGLMSFHTGAEWTPTGPFAFRIGYRTDTVQGLSPLAGLTIGFGLHAWGQEFSYAWLPLSDLGNTQYFSMVMRFGGSASRNLIQYNALKPSSHRAHIEDKESDPVLMELLSENKSPSVKKLSRSSADAGDKVQ